MQVTGRDKERQPGRRVTAADVVTFLRVPLAITFLLVDSTVTRLLVVAAAAASDLLDGYLARRYGSSNLGVVLDPVCDKLFYAATFFVVWRSAVLTIWEILGVLLRDIVAAIAFATTAVAGRPTTLPARPGGKAVTVGQLLTLTAFLFDSELTRPMAWATTAIAVYAIADYSQAAKNSNEKRP